MTMSATDVSDTLEDALKFTGLDQVKVRHKPRLLSDNGPKICFDRAGDLSQRTRHDAHSGQSLSSADPGQDRTLASVTEEPSSSGQPLSAGETRRGNSKVRRLLQSRAVSRIVEQSDTGGCLHMAEMAILKRRAQIKRNTLAMRLQMH